MIPTPRIEVVSDNGARFHASASVCPETDRTIVIRIRALDREPGYEVTAWGGDLPQRSSSFLRGHLRAKPEQVRGAIANLRDTWLQEVVHWQRRASPERPEALYRYPYAEQVSLRGVPVEERQHMWRELARAGHELFNLLFVRDDDGLRQLGRRLADALRSGQQAISIHSSAIVAPWSMLYVPPVEGGIPDDVPVDRTGFWGYRHLVEHNFDGNAHSSGHIPFEARVNAAAYTDQRLDTRSQRHARANPVIKPIVRLLNRRTDLEQFTTKSQLEVDLRGRGRDRALLYFCCHCFQVDGDPILRLSEDAKISEAHFRGWLGDALLMRGPFVFMNACASANPGTASHFGELLLEKGANCFLGPYVSVPAEFARAYAAATLCWVLRPGMPAGWVARHLTQHFADRHDNPLGLSYCLYQGMDSHFCPTEDKR